MIPMRYKNALAERIGVDTKEMLTYFIESKLAVHSTTRNTEAMACNIMDDDYDATEQKPWPPPRSVIQPHQIQGASTSD